MEQEYQLLQQDMLHDIERCLKLPHPEKQNVESCFWIAKNYCEKLKELVKQKGFNDVSREIEFFREVKPQFTFYIQYYVLLSEALQFVPMLSPVPDEIKDCITTEVWQADVEVSIIDFWENEGKRFKRFCDKHREFIEYFESDNRRNDCLYFLRESDVTKDYEFTSLYDMDKSLTTSYERLLGSYLANKKYWEYCKERLVESKTLIRGKEK